MNSEIYHIQHKLAQAEASLGTMIAVFDDYGKDSEAEILKSILRTVIQAQKYINGLDDEDDDECY